MSISGHVHTLGPAGAGPAGGSNRCAGSPRRRGRPLMAWSPRTALVTGASSGIGRGVALALAKRGVSVVAVARRGDRLDALASEAGADLIPLPLDLADEHQVGGLADALADRGLQVDLLINNAGYACPGPIEAVPPAAIRRQFEVNLVGLIGITQAVLPPMRANGRGRIVNVSSVAGIVSLPFLGIYCASKFALEGLSDALRLELRPFGIDVLLVEPAAIASDFANVTLVRSADTPEEHAYGRWYDPAGLHAGSEANAAPLELAVSQVLRIALAQRAVPRTIFPARGRRLAAMKRWLPARVMDGLLQRRFRLGD